MNLGNLFAWQEVALCAIKYDSKIFMSNSTVEIENCIAEQLHTTQVLKNSMHNYMNDPLFYRSALALKILLQTYFSPISRLSSVE